MSGKKRDVNANFRIKLIVDTLFEGNQSQFAEAVEVKRGMVSEWISGKHSVRHATMIKMANRLEGKVSRQWLLNGYGDPQIQSARPSLFNEDEMPRYGFRPLPSPEQAKIDEAAKKFDSLKEATNDADKKTSETYRKFGQLLKQVFEIGKEIGYFSD